MSVNVNWLTVRSTIQIILLLSISNSLPGEDKLHHFPAEIEGCWVVSEAEEAGATASELIGSVVIVHLNDILVFKPIKSQPFTLIDLSEIHLTKNTPQLIELKANVKSTEDDVQSEFPGLDCKLSATGAAMRQKLNIQVTASSEVSSAFKSTDSRLACVRLDCEEAIRRLEREVAINEPRVSRHILGWIVNFRNTLSKAK